MVLSLSGINYFFNLQAPDITDYHSLFTITMVTKQLLTITIINSLISGSSPLAQVQVLAQPILIKKITRGLLWPWLEW